jgi:hypothetical protein
MQPRISLAVVLAAIFIACAAVAPSAKAAPPEDACSLLTPAQIGAAIGVPVSAGTYITPTYKKTCTWKATSQVNETTPFVTLMLQDVNGYEGGKRLAAVKTITVTPVSGIGEGAYYLALGDNAGLIVKKGGVAFKVAVYIHLPLAKKEAMEKPLAQDVLSRL